MEFIKTLFQLFNYLFLSAFEFSPFILPWVCFSSSQRLYNHFLGGTTRNEFV